ncbi:hypothetical protein AVEN_256939-1 [Araneus ventricosus]|uniref:Uncharacterized protein n=1 Tax=Araneus ventricosus TaxID=182803 RepID=A0A4Y2ECX3_ARAVE|nr:hypothetical protein AVEN_256939-1 [Araneus ventricosus]
MTDYPYLGVGSLPKQSKQHSDINGDCTIKVDARRARVRPAKSFTEKPGRPRKQCNIKEEIKEAHIALKDDIPSCERSFKWAEI